MNTRFWLQEIPKLICRKAFTEAFPKEFGHLKAILSKKK